MKIDAIILAGGKGTRLQSIIKDIPKPLAPIGKRPFIDIILNQLKSSNLIRKVFLSIGYKAEAFFDFYKNKEIFPFNLEFCVEQKPLGTGGAIQNCIKQTISNPVMVLNGDSFTDLDFKNFIDNHVSRKAQISIVLSKVPDTARYGRVDFDPNTKRITTFVEKDQTAVSGFINSGIYLLNRGVFENYLEEPYSFEETILKNPNKKAIYGFLNEGKFLDIGIPESYLSAQLYLKDELERFYASS